MRALRDHAKSQENQSIVRRQPTCKVLEGTDGKQDIIKARRSSLKLHNITYKTATKWS